jgi:hypothetical protein
MAVARSVKPKVKVSKLHEVTFLRESGSKRLLERAITRKSGAKVYRGVTIIQSGLGNRKDRNYYPDSALSEGVKEGIFEGLTAYVDHPDSVSEEIHPERTLRDRAGIYTNTRFRESKNGTPSAVVGDLMVHRHQKWLSSMIDELVEAGQADKIGISINGSGKTKPAKIRLNESESVDVNLLEKFLRLKSADLVTEAGAGGGFQELLESVRGSRGKTMKLTRKALKDLQEKAAAGDSDAIQKLGEAAAAALAETSDSDEEPKLKKKKAKKVEESDEESEKEEDDPDDEETEEGEEEVEEADEEPEEDHDQRLEDAIEEATSEDDEPEEDDEELEESDEETEEDDEEELEEADDEDADKRKKKLKSAASKLKTRESNLSRSVHGKNGQGGTRTKRANQESKQGGRGWPTASKSVKTTRESGEALIMSLRESRDPRDRKIAKLLERNATLSTALRIRQTADRARKLLRESEIPEDFRPELVPLLIGKGDSEARKIITYHERLLKRVGDMTLREVDDDEAIEGAGSRIREGGFGGNEDLGGIIDELLPMKSDDEDDQ